MKTFIPILIAAALVVAPLPSGAQVKPDKPAGPRKRGFFQKLQKWADDAREQQQRTKDKTSGKAGKAKSLRK